MKQVFGLIFISITFLFLPAVSAFADSQIIDNGTGSSNSITTVNNTSTVVTQSSSAVVTNVIKSNVDTGGNNASDNTGGQVSISTGNAVVVQKVANSVNANSVNGQSPTVSQGTSSNFSSNGSSELQLNTSPSTYNTSVSTTTSSSPVALSEAVVEGNGGGSENQITVENNSTQKIIQNNFATILNKSLCNLNTGENNASANIGSVEISTGNVGCGQQIVNKANLNIAKVTCLICQQITTPVLVPTVVPTSLSIPSIPSVSQVTPTSEAQQSSPEVASSVPEVLSAQTGPFIPTLPSTGSNWTLLAEIYAACFISGLMFRKIARNPNFSLYFTIRLPY